MVKIVKFIYIMIMIFSTPSMSIQLGSKTIFNIYNLLVTLYTVFIQILSKYCYHFSIQKIVDVKETSNVCHMRVTHQRLRSVIINDACVYLFLGTATL